MTQKADPVDGGASALTIQGLRVVFGDFVAIPNLNFSACFGEVHAIIGPNGAGKTTLLDVITGKTQPETGSVVLENKTNLLKLDESAIALSGVGRKFQKPSVFEAMSVSQNLEIAMRQRPESLLAELRSWKSKHRTDRVNAVLEQIGLEGLANDNAGTLAHGQKQWLEIGMLLMQQPRLLMLDEPAAGMSSDETRRSESLIEQLRAPERSILVIEHDMAFVEAVADRVTVLHEGEAIFEGGMAEVRKDARVRSVYLGR